MGKFPDIRMRRNRNTEWTRRMVAESCLSVDDLIWPVFIREENGEPDEILFMSGQFRVGLDQVIDHVGQAVELGIPAIALFPVTPDYKKDSKATEATNPNNIICQAARRLKSAFPDLGLIGDIALDPYTDHGHDGIVVEGYVDNDITINVLKEQAVTLARSGIDIVAPSDMMDGRVSAIRSALDAHKMIDTKIMSYAAKYASGYYGPFREALGSNHLLKSDKRTYQMDPSNSDEALREVALDLDEGADMVMIKPGMPYLDIIQRVKSQFSVPTFAYQVSGEYAMLKKAFTDGILDPEIVILENLLSFKRAGCDGIFTYFALDAAKQLKNR